MNIVHKGEVINTPKKLAEIFNDFFIEKVDKIVEQCPPNLSEALNYTADYLGDRRSPEWDFEVVTTEEVNKMITELKNTGSTGTDGLSTLTLKKFKEFLVGPLIYIVNKSLYTCVYPRLWKEGAITPLPKKPSCPDTSINKRSGLN